METLWSDTRHAARALFKRPGFTLVVTLTLAVGVGANTAIFSLIYGILLRPFPYLAPDRLVKIESVYAKSTGSVQGASQLDLDDWRRHTKSFDNIGLHITYPDRKSTRLNSSHVAISYAVFCLKKKNRSVDVLQTSKVANRYGCKQPHLDG